MVINENSQLAPGNKDIYTVNSRDFARLAGESEGS